MMIQERVCEVGVGLPILIQHYQNRGSRSIITCWCASSWRATAREKPEGARGTPAPLPTRVNYGGRHGRVVRSTTPPRPLRFHSGPAIARITPEAENATLRVDISGARDHRRDLRIRWDCRRGRRNCQGAVLRFYRAVRHRPDYRQKIGLTASAVDWTHGHRRTLPALQ